MKVSGDDVQVVAEAELGLEAVHVRTEDGDVNLC